MNVLVTGANGLLGHHVVMELLAEKHKVKIIVRSTQNIHFNLEKIETVVGDFTQSETLKMAATGCDAIIHIAAVTATDLLHYNDYRKVNVLASEQLISVADELNIKNLVFVSTANTIGYGTTESLADENAPIEYPFSSSFYARSKVEAEQLFVDYSKKPDRHVIIINPTFMIGAYDPKPSSGKLMLMGYKKRIMFVPRGGKNFVSVTDVAKACCHALAKGRNGERYLASGVNLSFKQFYMVQRKVGEYKQKLIVVPDFFLNIAGVIGDFIRKKGIKTEVCTMNLRQLMIREYYTNQKAKLELRLPEKSLVKSIEEALEWFKTNGMIK